MLVSAEPLALFGRRFQLQAHQHFRPARHIVLSDGDEGLERLRENYFPQATWLLDRWHLIQAVRALTLQDQKELARIMAPIWRADSEAALEALRTCPCRHQRPKEFRTLFGYLLGNRQGIGDWTQIPSDLRRSTAAMPAPVKPSSGAVEKNIEVHINRRFKRQGRSWQPRRAQYLLQLKCLYAQPPAWNTFWNAPPPFHPKPNPP